MGFNTLWGGYLSIRDNFWPMATGPNPALHFQGYLNSILTLVMMGWFWWEATDWSNDLYIVTRDRIIDVEKHPLKLSEERREASLGMIQNVSLRMPSIFANLFQYGDVLVQTAGAGEFTF